MSSTEEMPSSNHIVGVSPAQYTMQQSSNASYYSPTPAAVKSPNPDIMSSVPSTSWLCHVCGNINKEKRVQCNMAVCRAPKGFPGPFLEVAVGTPSPELVPTKWRCSVCQDVNRGRREMCYRTGCTGTRQTALTNPKGQLERPTNASPSTAHGEHSPQATSSQHTQPPSQHHLQGVSSQYQHVTVGSSDANNFHQRMFSSGPTGSHQQHPPQHQGSGGFPTANGPNSFIPQNVGTPWSQSFAHGDSAIWANVNISPSGGNMVMNGGASSGQQFLLPGGSTPFYHQPPPSQSTSSVLPQRCVIAPPQVVYSGQPTARPQQLQQQQQVVAPHMQQQQQQSQQHVTSVPSMQQFANFQVPYSAQP